MVVEWPSTRGMSTSRPPAASTSAAADDFVGAVIASLDQDVGANRRDQLEGRVFVEDRDGVDDLEGAQDLGAGLGRVDRAAWPFQAAHARVGVQADDQEISQVGRLARAAARGRDAAGRSSRW